MKQYESPTLLVMQFHTDDILAFSIGGAEDEVETPIIPFKIPSVDLGY